MKIPRPRLLAASLVAAAVIGIVGGVLVAKWTDGGGGVDAQLSGPGEVVTYPDGGLTNDEVEGDRLPIVTLGDAAGNDVSTGDFLGSPLVINFWFSTCPPCAEELPAFAEVHAEVGDDVRFIGVNTIDSVEVMERFAGERGVRYELYRDEYAELTDGIGAAAFPITIFVDSDGVIVEQTGALDADELRRKVAELQAAEAA
jgi:thiol-disulfide isomerase/thioredoxin